MSWGISLWIYPVWGSLGFLGLGDCFLPHFREVFNCYLLEYFLMAFLFVFFWDSYNSNVGAFNIVSEVSEVVLISFNSFFFLFSSLLHLSLPLCLPPHIVSSAPVILLLVPSRVLLISFIALLIDSSLLLLRPC